MCFSLVFPHVKILISYIKNGISVGEKKSLFDSLYSVVACSNTFAQIYWKKKYKLLEQLMECHWTYTY